MVETLQENWKQAERGVLVDAGRKFWSKEKLLTLIDEMSVQSFNRLQFHFSDNEGMRVECKAFPEITSEEHLTQEEVKEILSYAKSHGIEIIPEFDIPGHLKQVLAHHLEWCLEMKTDTGEMTPLTSALDITNREAVAFISAILEEYMTLFEECSVFHLGADEFIDFDELEKYPSLGEEAKRRFGEKAHPLDCYIDFVNQMSAKVKKRGFITRVWNDGFLRLNADTTVPLDKELEICYWTRWDKFMAPVSTWLENGYRLVNFNDNYFYYVLGNSSYAFPTAERIHKEWEINEFSAKQIVSEEEMSQVIGTYLSIWADKPDLQTCDEILAALPPILESIAQKERKEKVANGY
ncbi:MAG: family 20 glycosylhydrolase [Lactobacillales bacterium]|nr:family 20 glycosylhydrolase [Lactobacillales bacterium]